MLKEDSINLVNLVLSISEALDLASAELASHQQRTAYVSWEVGKALGFSEERLERVFVAALLHDIGALTPEEKVAAHRSEIVDPSIHCLRGEALFIDKPWLGSAARIVRYHHTSWSKLNLEPNDPALLESQVLLLADTLERAVDRSVYILLQEKRLVAMIRSLAGTEIHPEVVDAFLTFSDREEFWLDLVSPRLYSILLHLGPYRKLSIGHQDLASLALLFRNIIDFRSRFTATHSSGVAECAMMVSRMFGLSEQDAHLMEVAGNFHDLGKLVVPNAILEKPGRLTPEEYAVVRQHAYWTYAVIKNIGGMDQIAEWAAFHQEKLDGTGYPFHLRGERLSSGARVMAVADVFTALIEDRPYRKGMTKDQVITILRQQAERNALDRTITQLVFDRYDEIEERVKGKQAETREFYERQFLRPGVVTEDY